jgi:hypothetical protein
MPPEAEQGSCALLGYFSCCVTEGRWTIPTKRSKESREGLLKTPKAAARLNITIAQFRSLIIRNHLQPQGTYINFYRCRCPLWSNDALDVLKETEEVARLQNKPRWSRPTEVNEQAVRTRVRHTMERAKSIAIAVPVFTREKLLALVCKRYNERAIDPQSSHRADPAQSDQVFLARITVKFLMRKVGFHKRRKELAGKVGTNEAHIALQRRMLNAIAVQYPWLAAECNRRESGLGATPNPIPRADDSA